MLVSGKIGRKRVRLEEKWKRKERNYYKTTWSECERASEWKKERTWQEEKEKKEKEEEGEGKEEEERRKKKKKEERRRRRKKKEESKMTKDYQWPPVVQPIIKERKKEKKRSETKGIERKGKEWICRYLGTQSCKKQCISWPLGLHLLKLIRHSIEIKKKIKKWTINISENTGFDQSFLELTLINPHDCNNLKYDWNHAGSMSRQSESTGKARSSAMIWSQSNKRCVDNSQKNDYNHSWKWLKSSSIVIPTWFQHDSNVIPTWFQHDFEWTFGAVFHKASDISGKLNPIRWSDSYVLVFSLPYVMCWLQSANWVIVITWYSDWIQRRRKQRNKN